MPEAWPAGEKSAELYPDRPVNEDRDPASKLDRLALLRRGRRRAGAALLAAALAAIVLASGKFSPHRADRASERTASVRSKGESPPSQRRLSPYSSVAQVNEPDPIEELERLTAAREDPDPSLRLAALDNWVRGPQDTLDPLTHALVDPDESVRQRAQELLEEALARR